MPFPLNTWCVACTPDGVAATPHGALGRQIFLWAWPGDVVIHSETQAPSAFALPTAQATP